MPGNRSWAIFAAIGGIVWILLALFAAPQGLAAFWFLGETLLFAVLVIVPLGLDLISRPDRQGQHPWTWRIALWSYWPCAAGAAAAVHIDSPVARIVGGGLWCAHMFLIAGFGVSRLSWSGFVAIEELIINLGCFYAAVGGFWFLAYAAGWSFGFDNFIVLLTAMHFHFAGFAAPVIAGLLGRIVPSAPRTPRQMYSVAAFMIGIAPALVGVGIAGAPAIEVVAAISLAAGLLLLSVGTVVWTVWRIEQILGRILIVVSVMGAVVPMFLAMKYAAGEFSGKQRLDLQTMAAWHGMLNAYGFAGAGLIGLALVRPGARLTAPWPPLSGLRAGARVGEEFFKRLRLIREKHPAAEGLVVSLEDHRREGFDPDKVAPAIRHFYEHTREWSLHVRASWAAPFAGPARLYRVWARRVGQMVLPIGDLAETDMESSIGDLDDAADGRSRVRYWVRTCRASGDPVYVAAYSMHKMNEVAYMNIAFPLPGGNLTSILRFDHHPGAEGGVLLSTLAAEGRRGDEGIYLVRSSPVRLPLQEAISVWTGAEAPPDFPTDLRGKSDDSCCARHDVWFCGLRCLTLWYRLQRLPPGGAGANMIMDARSVGFDPLGGRGGVRERKRGGNY